MELKTLFKIGYGVYVISSKKGDKFNGQIANTVFQVTAEPPQIAICINKQNLTHEFIQESKVFTASILSKETVMGFIGDFGFKSGREVDKFEAINYKLGITGAPIVLDNAVGYLEAEVVNNVDVGTHTVFIGKVVEAQILKDVEPMTYAYYHEVKRGTSPKTAPTYVNVAADFSLRVIEEKKMRCTICRYIYDPEKGDPDSGIKPGTPFEKLPNNWVCPICGVGKDQFEKEVKR